MRIEFLYWEGCASHPAARALLDEVLAERGLEPELEVREIVSQEEAERVGFAGSPTILVDGRDVDPAGASAPAALACRIYRRPDGSLSGTPSREQLEEALTR